MANINLLVPKILHWEGENIFIDDPDDAGGATKDGVTLNTWQQCGYDKNHDGHIDKEDVKLLTVEDFKLVLRKYWNAFKGDLITNQSIAETCVDWLWGSGANAIIHIQRILKCVPDGIVGPNTLTSINKYPDQEHLFGLIKVNRILFVQDIVKKNPSQQKWLQGWLNRINYYTYNE